MPDRLPITALLLTGGKSSRMGRDKALLPWKGATLLTHGVSELSGLCEELILCGDLPEAARDTRHSWAPDLHPGIGPMGGLHAGLRAAKSEWIFLLACDMPFFSAQIVHRLWEEAETFPGDAVIPCGPAGVEPLHALVRKSALPRIEAAIEQARFGLMELFCGETVKFVSWERLRHFSPDGACFHNWNRPEDLPEAMRSALAAEMA